MAKRTVDRRELGELEAVGFPVGERKLRAATGRATRVELARQLIDWLKVTPAPDRACGICECTEAHGCIRAEGRVCFWAAPGLCSACAVRLGAVMWQGLRYGELIL